MNEKVAKRLIDLKSCIEYLEKAGKLVRVKSEVDSKYDLAGIAKKFEGGKCVLFERVSNSQFPVFIGMLWNRDIIGSLFGVPKEDVPSIIVNAVEPWQRDKDAFPSPIHEKGPANELIEKDIDMSILPIPIHAIKDGGKYLDSSVILAKNPQTGIPNTSIHRMMVTKKRRLTFVIDSGRHLGAYMEIMEKRNQPLPVTINNGIGILPWLVSSIPGQGDGKYGIANHIIRRPIHFIKAQTSDVPAYADAQFVIEAEILPHIRESEGPFGEITGYYGSKGKRWVMRVKAITHQENPIFHSLLAGQEVWNASGLTAEAKIYKAVKNRVPQLMAVYLTPGGCGLYCAVVQVKKDRKDVGKQVIMETFKAFGLLQRVVAVDTDVNLYDPIDVDWAITTRFNPHIDMITLKNQQGHILNPIVETDKDGKARPITKMGIDATAPYPRTDKFERFSFKEVDLKKYQIFDHPPPALTANPCGCKPVEEGVPAIFAR